ncbi:pyridoxal 5'-phosphate synthase glutaminase subunit PdxT [Proteiniclasticum sp. QWL-01]|uniref:pyridoxal 5'-phosphate synthase glutaminase subunit PdxT n=1 Tax=Proteiniclasticum sp. QWL-01 TaxID=3036945 RepID=UPI00241117FA|nr:pyridoxal 5'-phosphate synthase glutaminase subunit PdxT [Proteiniclasticum sp. QWL-01]WFF74066.1 pyridoxal 5'-phosphate synthase glutaminase subunit PdxT [Proteiniclasticum sp. QWL-01]
MRVGVLALQGAFAEHRRMLEQRGIESFEIRQLKDLDGPMDGLILPGGESTVMGQLLTELGLMEPLRQKISQGLPVFGTCAGMILLARSITEQALTHFATMDIHVRRNAFGRQLGSFEALGTFSGNTAVPMRFIRAPFIEKVGPETEILSMVQGKIVAARQDSQLVTAFHPELTDDTFVHDYFIEMIRSRQAAS